MEWNGTEWNGIEIYLKTFSTDSKVPVSSFSGELFVKKQSTKIDFESSDTVCTKVICLGQTDNEITM